MTATPACAVGYERRELEYVYEDGDGLVLLDPVSEELVSVPEATAAALARYFKEGDRVGVLFQAGQPLALEPPAAVQLRVVETETPGGLAAAFALLETGARIRVPGSIAVGELVRVDPRSGAYLGRA